MHASSGVRARTRHGNTATRVSRVPLFMNVTRTVDPLIRGCFLLVSREPETELHPPKPRWMRSHADIRGPSRKKQRGERGWIGGVEKRGPERIQSSAVIYDAFSRSNRDFRKSAIILPPDSSLFPPHDRHRSYPSCRDFSPKFLTHRFVS